MTTSPAESVEESLAEQAAGWLICFQTTSWSADEPYRDPTTRNAAFFEWAKRSPAHLQLFMEMMQLEHRLHRLDSAALVEWITQ